MVGPCRLRARRSLVGSGHQPELSRARHDGVDFPCKLTEVVGEAGLRVLEQGEDVWVDEFVADAGAFPCVA